MCPSSLESETGMEPAAQKCSTESGDPACQSRFGGLKFPHEFGSFLIHLCMIWLIWDAIYTASNAWCGTGLTELLGFVAYYNLFIIASSLYSLKLNSRNLGFNKFTFYKSYYSAPPS